MGESQLSAITEIKGFRIGPLFLLICYALLTSHSINQTNKIIFFQRLGESKLSAMTESKDFRIGTRLLLWEKEKLTMEYEDLQAKWTEIQQTKARL